MRQRKGLGCIRLHSLAGMVLMLLAALVLLGGCGKKPPVETAPPPPEPVVTPPPPIVQEEPKPPEPAPIDYATMDPSAYGIQDVYFPYDVHAVSEQGMATLETNAGIMKEHATISYLIEGHCDERGTVEYNLALGEKRAKATRDYLISLGVAADRLKVISYGEERPFAMGNDESAWGQNRRAHFARP